MGRKLKLYKTVFTLAAVAQRPLLFAAIYRPGPRPSHAVVPLTSAASTCCQTLTPAVVAALISLQLQYDIVCFDLRGAGSVPWPLNAG